MIRKRVMSLLISIILVFSMLISVFPIGVSAQIKTDDNRVIVSLGDSYSAGEGLHDYYGETYDEEELMVSEDFLSHRSRNSWPAQLKVSKDSSKTMKDSDDWYFVAMSGAITNNVMDGLPIVSDKVREKGDDYKYKQYWEVEWEQILLDVGLTKLGLQSGWKTLLNVPGHLDRGPEVEIERQINIFDKAEVKNKEIDYVTMTMGGNDVEFAEIVKTLILPSYLNVNWINDQIATSTGYMDGTLENLGKVYRSVAEKAGDQATIVVAGYPRFMEPNGRGILISQYEATRVNAAIGEFNLRLKNYIEECKKDINIEYVSVEEEFEGHEIYSDDPWMYNYEWIIKPDDISDLDPFNGVLVSSASFHPNREGAAAYARCVNKKLDELDIKKASHDMGYEIPVTTEAPRNNIITQEELIGTWDMTIYIEDYFSQMLNSPDINNEELMQIMLILDWFDYFELPCTVEFYANGTYTIEPYDTWELQYFDYIEFEEKYILSGDTLYLEGEGFDYGIDSTLSYTYDGNTLTLGRNSKNSDHPLTGCVLTKIS